MKIRGNILCSGELGGLCCRWNAYHQNLDMINEMKHLLGACIWKNISNIVVNFIGSMKQLPKERRTRFQAFQKQRLYKMSKRYVSPVLLNRVLWLYFSKSFKNHREPTQSVWLTDCCPRRDCAQKAKSRGGTLVTRSYIEEIQSVCQKKSQFTWTGAARNR